MDAVKTYFQIMRLRLSGLSNDRNPQISARAREILDEIRQTDKGPWECLEEYWDESQELKKRYWEEH